LESTTMNEGRGTGSPFLLAGRPGLPAKKLASDLNRASLPGVSFAATVYTPKSIPGVASSPRYINRDIPGLKLEVINHSTFRPVETAVHLLSGIYGPLPESEKRLFFREKGFGMQAGTDRLQKAIEKGVAPEEIISMWQGEIQRFREQRKPYLLY
jgi:uncharacterized protein YbbC (DUF1343 family)